MLSEIVYNKNTGLSFQGSLFRCLTASSGSSSFIILRNVSEAKSLLFWQRAGFLNKGLIAF